MSSQALELVLRRDRAIIVAALIVITGLAWAYVLWLANDMAMDGMDMPDFRMIPSGMGLMMPVSAPWPLPEPTGSRRQNRIIDSQPKVDGKWKYSDRPHS